MLTGVFTDYQLMYKVDLGLYIIGLVLVAFLMDLKMAGKKD
jgi:hypothetical protein